MAHAAHAERSTRRPGSLRCLVLNADFRPLSTWPLSLIPAQDAVSAVWRERAVVVEDWPGAFFRSPSTTIAVPKVVALKAYANVSGDPKFCRRSILLRDRYRCQYCGQRFESHELTFDHLVPRAAPAARRYRDHCGRSRSRGVRPLLSCYELDWSSCQATCATISVLSCIGTSSCTRKNRFTSAQTSAKRLVSARFTGGSNLKDHANAAYHHGSAGRDQDDR